MADFKEINSDTIETINKQEPVFLERAKAKVSGRITYICPKCKHGANGDGVAIDPHDKSGTHWKCFGNCNEYGDVIHWYGIYNHTEGNNNFIKNVKALAAFYNLPVKDVKTPEASPKDNYNKDYFLWRGNWSKYPQGVAYLQKRGISLETAIKYGVGFCPNWISPTGAERAAKAGRGLPPASARVIFPVTSTHYVARAIDDTINPQFKKQKQGEINGFFNQKALASGRREIFLLEGEFDALSVLEVGAEAIALGSVNNRKRFIEALKATKNFRSKIILCLDSDDVGQRTQELLAYELKEIGVTYAIANINGQYKDANEHISRDKKAFSLEVKKAIDNSRKPDNANIYLDSLFNAEIEQFINASQKKTGFRNLDFKAGGLFPGLYVVMGGTSVGKTTFSLQLADQLCQQQQDVIYFSLEQSKLELISKSLARITADIDTTAELKQALTSLAIRKGNRPAILTQAITRYKNTIAPYMSIVEGNFACDITTIKNYVLQYKEDNDTTPVIVIDYLQLLQPENDRDDIRLTMNNAVTILRQLARDIQTPIIVISAIGRTNNLLPISDDSARETSGIEYTADVIWGLQLSCQDETLFDRPQQVKQKRERLKEAKRETPRKITLKCLKNRYGINNFDVHFDYYCIYDWYRVAQMMKSKEEKARPEQQVIEGMKIG